MKVLFVGEYSGVYTELISQLKLQNIETFSISNGDGYKKYPADILIKKNLKKSKNILIKFINNIKFRLGIDGIFVLLKQWNSLKKHLVGFDIVQIINPVPFSDFGSIANIVFLRYINKHNRIIVMSVLGDDYYTLKWISKANPLNKAFVDKPFSFFFRPSSIYKYKYCLFYKYLNNYVIKISKCIIPGSYAYKKSYEWNTKTSNMIPFPISDSKISIPIRLVKNSQIIIFHGWQVGKDLKKGNLVFEKVIKKVIAKYGNKVQYKIVKNVPYNEYLKLFSDSHIYIDQLYAFDKGMNGLLGMAAGKVVFSGFTEEALNMYPNYNGSLVGIKSYNDEDYLYNKFCELIDNPSLIEEISKNAIQFVKQNHTSYYITQLYLNLWCKLLS